MFIEADESILCQFDKAYSPKSLQNVGSGYWTFATEPALLVACDHVMSLLEREETKGI